MHSSTLFSFGARYPIITCRVSPPASPPVASLSLPSSSSDSLACSLQCPHFQSYALLADDSCYLLVFIDFSDNWFDVSLNFATLRFAGAQVARMSSISNVRLSSTKLQASSSVTASKISLSIVVDWLVQYEIFWWFLFFFFFWIACFFVWQWGWRCRAKLAVRGTSDNALIGLYQEGTHSVVDIPECKGNFNNFMIFISCWWWFWLGWFFFFFFCSSSS